MDELLIARCEKLFVAGAVRRRPLDMSAAICQGLAIDPIRAMMDDQDTTAIDPDTPGIVALHDF